MSYTRTRTNIMDDIWSRERFIGRWVDLWIGHLQAQVDLNPNHPGKNDLAAYRSVQDLYHGDKTYREQFLALVDLEEQQTRHDVVAVLNVFNRQAGAHTAHMGLTSHDIVETATEQASATSIKHILSQVRSICGLLADQAEQTQYRPVVARTHGQPAQLMPYALRIVTIIDPLLHWIDRQQTWNSMRPVRPPYGAVGTGADLYRVLTGWGNTHSPYTDLIYSYAFRMRDRSGGGNPLMGATRQTYHRSHDLHTAALLAELASIAQTWAQDRRLEVMLGHGAETRGVTQVGSSAMPHKQNPIRAERICSLARVVNGHLATAAGLAAGEWLEGDVSGSAGRRLWMAGIYRAACEMLDDWAQAIQHWHIDWGTIEADILEYWPEMHTGAAMHSLVELGAQRMQAHQAVAQAVAQPDGLSTVVSGAQGLCTLARRAVGALSEIREDLVVAADRTQLEGLSQAWDLHLGPIQEHIRLLVNRARKV